MIKTLADLLSDESQLAGSQMALFLVFSHDRRDKRVLWGPFYEGTDSIHEGGTLMT